MRDYSKIDGYINQLVDDIYPQPEDAGHVRFAIQFILNITKEAEFDTVLDVGCGEGFCQPIFSVLGKQWVGVTLGTDFDKCVEKKLPVYKEDFSFLPFVPETYDLVFARHSLEHSVMPLLTLMEWRRVSRNYLAVVLPNPEHFHYFGMNHYSVMNNTQFLWLAARAGWKAFYKDYSEPQELRYLLKKDEPQIKFPFESEAELSQYGKL